MAFLTDGNPFVKGLLRAIAFPLGLVNAAFLRASGGLRWQTVERIGSGGQDRTADLGVMNPTL